jgi:MFS transporter, ACS family, hexuronate transporter
MGLTLPSDLFSPDIVASVTGLSGLGAGLTSTVFTLLVGVLVERFSYAPAFIVAALVPVIATFSILYLIGSGEKPTASEPLPVS